MAQQLGSLQAHLEKLSDKQQAIEQELRQVAGELEKLEANRPRYDALQEVCAALAKLEEQKIADLFWKELGIDEPSASLEKLGRVPGQYQEKLKVAREKKAALQEQLHRCQLERDHLDGEVDDVYLREQKRLNEFVVEREVPFFPMHAAVMPWSRETESERYFRRAILIALLISFLLGGLVPLVRIPVPDRYTEVAVIPERIAKLVKAPPAIPEPEPVAEAEPEKPKPEEEKPKDEKKDQKKDEKKPEPEEKLTAENAARQKVQKKGVLAFKESFKDLIVDAPSANQARITSSKATKSSGSAPARRSLVAMQATGSSGGIRADVVSRNIGSGTGGGGGSSEKISAVAFSRVESTVGEMIEKEERVVAGGPSQGRSDEDIQIVFDRYKATLYRIYNTELRKDPTLRGNIVLRITINPDGSVATCKVESTDLKSKELVDKIIDRVLKINFGPKDGIAKVTILYPIDFLPAR